MIRHNWYSEKQAPLHAYDYFAFELYSIADDGNKYERIFISFVKKIRAEGRNPLRPPIDLQERSEKTSHASLVV